RRLSRQVAELYLEQRQRLEYPLLESAWQEEPRELRPQAVQANTAVAPQTFVLEIGSEELPVSDLDSALRQLRVNVPRMLDDLRLAYDRVELSGTPRRLAVVVVKLEGRQPDRETIAKGPPADRAYDADGNPTKAAVGFARGKGVDVADLQIVEEGNKRYVTAVVREEGRPTVELLAEALPKLIAGIKFDKNMRWNHTNVAYSRPLRWIVALFGQDVVPFVYAGIASGRVSRGLRPYDSPELTIPNARDYTAVMRQNSIVLDVEKRMQMITAVGGKLAAEIGGTIPDDPELLREVANLVEKPTPLRGRFSQRYLKLPAAVLVAVMRKHQRYFPVYDGDGKLMPYFIAVRNGDEKHLDVVVSGNEHVIRARFSDAEFFYSKDIEQKLEDFLPRLDTLTFQAKLGSMLDKTHRLEKLTPQVAGMLDLSPEETAAASRAAALAKADLATNMVVEMTSLQGIMGGHYARMNGESEAVVTAIAEQYNAVSQTKPGLALALADRLDSLAGLFAAGLAPKGSNDPFALRRAALH
ncbi:MAG TPA: glycine--tRNA ligase subunit beta, partial [Anaerolineae bacterium]|nr:glycine--tRNA ligase subunit beta [Anaerolineae bacterium]